MSEVAEAQKPLFDTSVMREITPDWINPEQPLQIPTNPLHVKAHRLQVLLANLDRQAAKNGSAFNSGNYIQVLNEYIKCVTQIKEGKTADELLDEGSLDQNSPTSQTPPVGAGVAAGVGTGVSADNPITG